MKFFIKIIVTALVAVLHIRSALAKQGPDYSLGAGIRTLPKGASLSAELGYGVPLWGNSAPGEVFYGYMRTVTKLRTSALVNAGEVELQLAPISFFVLSGGTGASHRNVDSATIDCSQFDCRGVLGSQYIGSTLLLGAGDWAGGIDLRVDWLKPITSSATQQDFADENSVLVGKKDGDRLLTQRIFLAWSPLPNWRWGGFLSVQQMDVSSASNRTQGVFGKFAAEPWAFTAGLNFYESSTHSRSPGIFTAISWTGIPSISLH